MVWLLFVLNFVAVSAIQNKAGNVALDITSFANEVFDSNQTAGKEILKMIMSSYNTYYDPFGKVDFSKFLRSLKMGSIETNATQLIFRIRAEGSSTFLFEGVGKMLNCTSEDGFLPGIKVTDIRQIRGFCYLDHAKFLDGIGKFASCAKDCEFSLAFVFEITFDMKKDAVLTTKLFHKFMDKVPLIPPITVGASDSDLKFIDAPIYYKFSVINDIYDNQTKLNYQMKLAEFALHWSEKLDQNVIIEWIGILPEAIPQFSSQWMNRSVSKNIVSLVMPNLLEGRTTCWEDQTRFDFLHLNSLFDNVFLIYDRWLSNLGCSDLGKVEIQNSTAIAVIELASNSNQLCLKQMNFVYDTAVVKFDPKTGNLICKNDLDNVTIQNNTANESVQLEINSSQLCHQFLPQMVPKSILYIGTYNGLNDVAVLDYMLDESEEACPFPISTLLFATQYYEYYSSSAKNERQLQLMQNRQRHSVKFGCILDLLEMGQNFNIDLMKMETNKCAPEKFPNNDLYVWNILIDLRSIEKSKFEEIVNKIYRQLNEVARARLSFLEDNVDKQVWLAIDYKHTSDFEEYTTTLYCSQYRRSVNEALSAVMTWIAIHDIATIFRFALEPSCKKKTTSDDNCFSGWIEKVHRPPGLVLNSQTYHTTTRNHPSDLENHFPSSPCIYWSDGIRSRGLFNDSGIGGAAINGHVVNHTLNAYSFGKIVEVIGANFSVIEIILGDPELDISKIFSKQLIKPRIAAKLLFNVPLNDAVHGKEQFLQTTALIERLQGTNFSAKGIHISQSNSSLLEITSSYSSFFDFPLNDRLPRGVSLENCTRELNQLMTDQAEIPETPLSYVICDDRTELVSNQDRYKMKLLLDGHWITKLIFHQYFPNTTLYFRMTNDFLPTSEAEKANLIGFASDLLQFGKAYDIQYLFPFYDAVECDTDDCWRLDRFGEFPERIPTQSEEQKAAKKSSEGSSRIWWLIALVVVLLVSLCAAGLFILNQRKILKQNDVQNFLLGYDEADGNSEPTYLSQAFSTELQLNKADINFDRKNVLGIGNFGVVYKGTLFDHDVAVKVLHSMSTREALLEVLTEVKIMAYLGEHENILRLVGAYVKQISRGIIYIVTEFCEVGCLLDYLRRKTASQDEETLREGSEVDFTLMLKFSFEIATGMEYLTGKRIVHGDLAARNVFLNEYLQCKIGDFGLSRKIQDYREVINVNGTSIPWKWMSLETIERMEITARSDVWSFGVLLWEVYTMGNVPYPGFTLSLEFIENLKQGLRLEKPEIATQEIYNEMMKCWAADSLNRPSFVDLAQFFRSLRELDYDNVGLHAFQIME